MLLFVLFILMSIAFQHNFTYGETIEAVSTSDAVPSSRLATKEYGYTAHTMAFPVMSVRTRSRTWRALLAGWRCWRAELWRWCTAPPRWQTSPARYRPCGRRHSSALDSACPCWAEALEHPLGSGLEAVYCAVPLLPAGLAAHPAVEQRYFEPDAGAADFKPDVPPQAARGRAVPAVTRCRSAPPWRWCCFCRRCASTSSSAGRGGVCMALYFAYLAAACLCRERGRKKVPLIHNTNQGYFFTFSTPRRLL